MSCDPLILQVFHWKSFPLKYPQDPSRFLERRQYVCFKRDRERLSGYSTRGFTRPDLLDEKAWFHGRKMADCSVLRVVEFYSGVGGMHFALNGKGERL